MDKNPTSSYFDLISHPDRTLETHLKNCDEVSQRILNNKYISNTFIDKEELDKMRKTFIYFHDFGKATDFFQQKIITATIEDNPSFANENKEYIDWFFSNKNKQVVQKLIDNERLSNHALIGSYIQFLNYKSCDEIINLILLEIIKRHHGFLRNFDKTEFWLQEEFFELSNIREQSRFINYDLFTKILNKASIKIDNYSIDKVINDFVKGRTLNKSIVSLCEKKDLKYFFVLQFLFSLLLSADKGDMMLKNFKHIDRKQLFDLELINRYKLTNVNRDKEIDKQREDAYNNIIKNLEEKKNKNFFSITLPTGLGKTFSAYNAAIHIQNSFEEFTFRIVYCLPFTSIIDQNEKILSDIFEFNNLDTSLICKHHHLSDYKEEYKENELEYSEAEYLTEGWEQEFIITTFIQLLESIFTNKNRSLRKFHNLVNSIIILDEVQNIPPKYYNLIEETFKKMAEYFGTKFIFVTATQPIIFRDSDLIIELTDPEKIKTRTYFELMDRIDLDISSFKKGVVDEDNLIQEIQNDIDNNPKKSFLIIANTIKQSQKIFTTLHVESPKYYLSASILPVFRKKRIEEIKKSIERKIVVSTQVVEAGVDIDLDIVYRDFAPLDSINQSAGRCNRNGIKEKGIVKIYDSGKAKNIYDSTLLNITRNIFSKYDSIIEEKEFYNLNMIYFQEVKKKIQDYNDKSRKLLNYMYELQMENLADEFKLIDNLPIYIDVFIPCNDEAKIVWKSYIKTFQIENNFERREKVKKIRPKVLQYVTKFPKKEYSLPNDQDKKKLVYVEDWQNYYDLETGFKTKTIDFI